MESSIYKWGLAEGQVKGRAEGLMAMRQLCREIVQKEHPRAGAKVWTAIDECTDFTALREVALHAAEWSTRDILRRLTEH